MSKFNVGDIVVRKGRVVNVEYVYDNNTSATVYSIVDLETGEVEECIECQLSLDTDTKDTKEREDKPMIETMKKDCTKTIDFLKEKTRMCDYYSDCGGCEKCPLDSDNTKEHIICAEFVEKYPEKSIALVQKWSDEHPEETFLSDFLKKYPNAPLDDDGTPTFCPCALGYKMEKDCDDINERTCRECWNMPLKKR